MKDREAPLVRRCRKCGRQHSTKKGAVQKCGKCGSRDMSWGYVVDVNAPGATKRARKSRTCFATKAEATKARNEELERQRRRGFASPATDSVASYLGSWLHRMERRIGYNLRQRSHDTMTHHVNHYIIPRIGDLPISRLRTEHLEDLYAELGNAGGRNGKPLAPKTVWNIHATLASALKDALDRGVIDRDIATGACAAPQGGKEREIWDEREMEVFLDFVRDDRYVAGWHLAVLGGMRRGEILGLRWRNVDLDAAAITITQALGRTSKGLKLEKPKTQRGRRTIKVSQRVVDALRKARRRQAEEKLVAGEAYDGDDYVIATALGKPVDPDNFSRRFRRLRRESKLRAITLHDVRHSHASSYLRAGVEMIVVSRRLGHESEAFTMSTYGHITADQQEDAVARHEAYVAKKVSGSSVA